MKRRVLSLIRNSIAMEENDCDKCALTFQWRIENFGYLESGSGGEKIQSPEFTALTLNNTEWCIRLYPNGLHESDCHVRVHLVLFSTTLKDPIDCEVSFLSADGSPIISGTIRNQRIINLNELDLLQSPTQEEVFVTDRSTFLPLDSLTVRCRIWSSTGLLERAEHIFARTRIDVDETYCVIPVKRLSALKLGQKVTTAVDFSFLPNVRGGSYALNFSMAGPSLDESNVALEMSAVKVAKPLSILSKITFLDVYHNAIECVENKHKLSQSRTKQTWSFPSSVSRRELLDKTCGTDDICTLLCEFAIGRHCYDGMIESMCYGPANLMREVARDIPRVPTTKKDDYIPEIPHQRSDSTTILREDFMSIFRDHDLSDYKLRSGDVSFPVHKMVLSARSSVFRAMFSSDMKEADSNSLDVPDVDAETLDRMLTFLYTGTVSDLLWENAAKLYYAADKYQVLSLRQECSSVLRSDISVSNVCEILALADRHQDDELTLFVHDFILGHYDEIVLSDEWDTFLDSKSHLAGKTMREIYKKKLDATKNK